MRHILDADVDGGQRVGALSGHPFDRTLDGVGEEGRLAGRAGRGGRLPGEPVGQGQRAARASLMSVAPAAGHACHCRSLFFADVGTPARLSGDALRRPLTSPGEVEALFSRELLGVGGGHADLRLR